MPPRTIDNLGVDVSTRYAQDQEVLEKDLIREAPSIPLQTTIEVTSPSYPSELDALLKTQPTHASWALFTPPEGYYEQKNKLFTFQLIPSLGSDDKKDSQTQKIEARLQAEEEKSKNPYELEQHIKKKGAIISLLKKISIFDNMITDVYSRIGQYKKG